MMNNIPVYLIFLTIFFVFPLAVLWFLFGRLLIRYKKTFILTIIPTFLFGALWDVLSAVSGLWRYDSAPTLRIWFGPLPIEEIFFTLIFPVFVVSLTVVVKKRLG